MTLSQNFWDNNLKTWTENLIEWIVFPIMLLSNHISVVDAWPNLKFIELGAINAKRHYRYKINHFDRLKKVFCSA